MDEERREIGRFTFRLVVHKRADGSLEYETEKLNDNIPVEIVIMQLKAFLNGLEKEYFSSFESGGE